MLHYDCYFIQEAHQLKDYQKMVSRYNRLVEDSIDFLVYSYSLILENSGEPKAFEVLNIDYEKDIGLVKDYTLVKLEDTC